MIGRGRRISAPERDEPRHRLEHGRMEADLLLAEPQGAPRFVMSQLELTAVGRDPGARDVILVPFDPVLEAHVAGMGSVVCCALPAPAPEFDPRELPQHVRAEQLIAFVPLSILAFEDSSPSVGITDIDESPLEEDVHVPEQPRIPGGVCEITGARRILGRARVAHQAPERGQVHECLEPEVVIVHAVRELDCRARAVDGGREALPEAFGPGEADVEERSEPRVRRRVAQRLLEDRNAKIVVLELREKEEGLGAERARLRLAQQIGRDRSRTRPLSGIEVRTGGSDRASAALILPIPGRQPERELREFGGERRRAAISRERRGVVEHTRDLIVRRVGGQREVTGAVDRVFDHLGDPCVNASPLLAEGAVEDRRDQRVGELDHPVLALDHARRDGRVEHIRGNTRPLEEMLRRRTDGRRQRKRPPGRRRERRNPRPYELVDRLGDRKRSKWIDICRKHAGHLQREEGIPTRPLVDAEQGLTRERHA